MQQKPFILDLHVHSKYSRGTSKQMDLENLYKFSKIKGIQVIGTGDFTHPAWFKEIKTKLIPDGKGLFDLKKELREKIDKTLVPKIKKQKTKFILTAEVSCIYSKNDKVRKMHNVLIAPDFKTVEKINQKLAKIGNIYSDGRPILGLDSKDLLELTLKANENSYFIPAHIWTPWFSMFGSKSGFDSIEEAFEELSPHIKTIETGLSSDPFMNWRLKQLKDISIVSNSDAHSPLKLGREATLINSKLDYFDIIDALKTNDQRLVGTIEFFPEEGKYHYDGHRACNVCFTPTETKKHQAICPKCHKPLVVGVDYRVNELADHKENYKPKNHKQVEYIIPLLEIISEILGVKTVGKKVLSYYYELINNLGNEFDILRQIPTNQIKSAGFDTMALAIKRLRNKKIFIQPGYDGVFGIIKVFAPSEKIPESSIKQKSLF